MRASTNTSSPEVSSVAVIGNYLPRKCGIATFTADLVESLARQESGCQCKTIAINDKPEGYDYPDEVHFEINQENTNDYHTAAEFINMNQADVVSLQHEFGIFGGRSGDYILKLLRDLQMPVITTLHTVLVEPTPKQESVMDQLIELSDRLVVMSKSAVNILETLYDISKEKINYIPHGIPDMPFVDPNYYKDKFNLLGQKVLLTFGLLSENKGIEYMINALPDVIERFPDLKYIVLGATHPNVLEYEGEKYRNKLKDLVNKLGLENHVIFKNHFVPFEKLCEYLAAADLYVTPYTKEEQITSGTLAYALGTGKAVVSTPYWYAREMLADGRGRLVPFEDSGAFSDAIIDLFENDAELHQMRKKAYDFNRNATWDEVGRRYLEVFHKVKKEQHQTPRLQHSYSDTNSLQEDAELPSFKLDHLMAMTDDTGMIQHATYTIPNRDHGYCTDDNARGLIFAVKANTLSRIDQTNAAQLEVLSKRYLSFLLHAFNHETGRFRNFMSFSGKWLESIGSVDSHGRALWALGITASLSTDEPHLPLAATLFSNALDATESFDSMRAIAFTLTGIDAYLNSFSGDSKARRIRDTLAERLFNKFVDNSGDDWPWLEEQITYSNGKLPHALLLSGRRMQREDMVQAGLRALDWLFQIQTPDGHFSPIGNEGWYNKNGVKARFDQQPLEAHGMIEVCIAAFQITDDEQWLTRAKTCFNWFLGQNDLNLSLYDEKTGGCRDGLESNKANQNEGAESTLAWLLSLTEMHKLSEDGVLEPSVKSSSLTTSNRG